MDTLCGLFGKSKQAFYKHKHKTFSDSKTEKAILAIVDYYRQAMPSIGGLKLYGLVRDILGDAMDMGRDKFLALLHRKKLVVRPRKTHRTTHSNHLYFKYPNAVKGLDIKHINQVWASDITYLYTIEDGFCYLHLVTDAFSRRIIGYSVSDTLEAKHTIEALRMAIDNAGGGNLCGTIHHSDRGVQYCCSQYVQMLTNHHIRISMTEDGNPTDNALAERVNGIIKGEFIDPYPTPKNLQEVTAMVETAIRCYNTLRPHLSLNMKTPMQVYCGGTG